MQILKNLDFVNIDSSYVMHKDFELVSYYPGHLKFFDVSYKGRRKIISNWMRSNIQLIVHHIPRIFAVMQTTWDDEIFNIIQLWMADHHGQKSGISLPRTLQLHQDAVLIKELIMIYETHKFKN